EAELEMVMAGEDLLRFQEVLTRVPVAEPLMRYAASLVLATHPEGEGALDAVSRYVSYGASPRGLQAIVRAARVQCALEGRTAVSIADIHQSAYPALRHRIVLNFEGQAENVDTDRLITQIIEQVPAPHAVG